MRLGLSNCKSRPKQMEKTRPLLADIKIRPYGKKKKKKSPNNLIVWTTHLTNEITARFSSAESRTQLFQSNLSSFIRAKKEKNK